MNKDFKKDCTGYERLPMVELLNKMTHFVRTQSRQQDPRNANFRKFHTIPPITKAIAEDAYRLVVQQNFYQRMILAKTGLKLFLFCTVRTCMLH